MEAAERWEKATEVIKVQVEEYLRKNWIGTYVPPEVIFNSEMFESVVRTGTSIMMNKVGIDTRPGSFVRAILNNDLNGAVGHGDHVNIRVIPFYATMKYNLSIEIDDTLLD
jgi:hypothetical protein